MSGNLPPLTVERRSGSPEESREIGRRLSSRFRGGEVIALVGELGSGKTTLARGLVSGLDCPDYEKVHSPTYVLEHVYEGRLPVRHYDAYRLGGSAELLGMGFEEHLDGESVLIVEWADRVASCLPEDRLRVEIDFVGGATSPERVLRFSGPAERWERVLRALQKNG